jgi:hypothetical protein
MLLSLVLPLSSANSLTFYYENTLSANRSDCANSLNSIVADIYNVANEFYYYANGKYLNQLGDYDSCVHTTYKGQYVLIILSGQVTDNYLFTKGGYGYFLPNMTSLVGICIPSTCNSTQISTLEPYFEHLALYNGYSSVNVSFVQQSQLLADKQENKSIYLTMVYLTVFVFIFCMALGTMVECSQVGNRQDMIISGRVVSCKYKDQNRRLLLQKENWALFFLAFSLIRNNLHLFAYRKNKKAYKQ